MKKKRELKRIIEEILERVFRLEGEIEKIEEPKKKEVRHPQEEQPLPSQKEEEPEEEEALPLPMIVADGKIDGPKEEKKEPQTNFKEIAERLKSRRKREERVSLGNMTVGDALKRLDKLKPELRILSFIVLGALLVTASLLYQQFKTKIKEFLKAEKGNEEKVNGL